MSAVLQGLGVAIQQALELGGCAWYLWALPISERRLLSLMVSRTRPQKATAMKPHCSSCSFADWITMLTVPALKTSEVIVNGLRRLG